MPQMIQKQMTTFSNNDYPLQSETAGHGNTPDLGL